MFNCGCVFSERAYKTISSSNLKCIKCDKPYKDIDLIVINPNDDDFELNKQKQKQRKEEIAKAVNIHCKLYYHYYFNHLIFF